MKTNELDEPIYRIIPVSRFIQLLTSKNNTLVKPKMWDDPFENLLLKSRANVGSKLATIAAQDSVYGQCWTRHRETDAMWRIYSPNKDGIRLRSTPSKLLEALKRSKASYQELSCFIGKVEYVPKKS